MDSGRLQGWHADPCALHEARYFSAGRPTKLVRDGAAEYYDEPTPPESWRTVPVAVPAHVPAGVFTPAQVIPAPARPAAAVAEPVAAAPPRNRPWAAFAAAAVIVFGTIGGLIAMTHEVSAASKSGTQASAALVAVSAQQSMARETAEISLSGTMRVSGHLFQLRGTGVVSFAVNAMAINAGYRFSGYSFAVHMVMIGGYTYLTVNGAGQDPANRHRQVQAALSESDPVGLTNLDLPSALSDLGELGTTVTLLGVKTIDGQSCTGFGVGPAAGTAASPVFATTVWVSPGQLLCRLTEVISQRSAQSAFAPGGQVVVDFSHYGAHVRITAPARPGPAADHSLATD